MCRDAARLSPFSLGSLFLGVFFLPLLPPPSLFPLSFLAAAPPAGRAPGRGPLDGLRSAPAGRACLPYPHDG